ncbi:hypothetical protein BJX70DRAFT_371360 [Aspergillus crustosus]
MAEPEKNVALVFGASGISGWAVTKNLLSYPSPTTFSRVIALTHRPRTLEETRLPVDPRLELYSGVNLRDSLEDVKDQLQGKIAKVEEITHVYYLAYTNSTAYSENVMDIKSLNVGMTSNAIHAADQLFQGLRFFLLQTGTNNYGVAVFQHIDKIELNPPLREDNPRVPSPYGDEIFYYAQVDLLKEVSKGKQWRWCEIRPDQIVGYAPSVTGMNYLALYRFVHGAGSKVSFPGTAQNFVYTFTESSQDIIARSEIYLSVTKPNEAHGEGFNIADTATPASWSVKWPILAEYFGLEGAGPVERNTDGENESGAEWGELDKWWDEHQHQYLRFRNEYGLRERVIDRATWMFVKGGFVLLDRDRELSLDKIRGLGFTEEWPAGKGHYLAFDQMAAEKIFPGRDCWV